MADEKHHMPAPTVKNEINLSTLGLAVGLLVSLGGLFYQTVSFKTSMEAAVADTDEWRARADQRIDALEGVAAKYDQLAYRVTLQEQGSATLSKALDDLRVTISAQGADLRVIREILTRIDQSGPRGPQIIQR